MALVTKRELAQLAQFHYVIELLLASAYIILKKISWLSKRVFETGDFDSNETELLVFAIIATALNTRRRGHVNFLPYISCACTMAKIANFILFFLNRPSYGLSYSVVILAHMLMFPKPRYRGPDQVTYFVGDDFERELTKDPKANWLIEFYETWNPDCNDFAGVFSELSAKFANEKLKFGKIDVSRSPKVAEKHQVVSSMTSRTLPTLILFKNGKESLRRPVLDSRRRVVPFSFSYENIVNVFALESQNK